jgi:SP family facilitated glucose transporter-like MFS transporter 8
MLNTKNVEQIFEDENKLSMKDFSNVYAIKSILTSFGIATLASVNGLYILLNYTESTIAKAGSTLKPSTSAIILAVVQMIGSFLTLDFVERFGRKSLLLISSSACGVFYAIFGAYSYAEYLNIDVSNYKFIPLLSFAALIFAASFGMMTIPFIVIPEILPPKVNCFNYFI